MSMLEIYHVSRCKKRKNFTNDIVDPSYNNKNHCKLQGKEKNLYVVKNFTFYFLIYYHLL